MAPTPKRRILFVIPVAITLVAVVVLLFSVFVRPRNGGNAALPGFRLVRPAFAQSVPSFPDPNAGISAYVKFPAGAIDFNKLVTIQFTGMTLAGDNYIIGQFPVGRVGDGYMEIGVFLYADTQGWMLAYLPKDKVAAEVMDVGGYVTVLRHALRWATANSVSGDQSAILDTTSYYHWQHLDATHFVIAQQVSSYKLYFAIPADATVYDVSVACFADNRVGNYQMVRLNGGVAVCEAPQAGLVTQPLSADKGGSVPNVVENWVGISYPLLNC